MPNEIENITEFLFEIDKLKGVTRRTYIKGGKRLENSAEHSWHLAMACWLIAEQLPHEYDVLKLIKLALIHDLGEIDAGDTFIYSENRDVAHNAERQCVKRIAAHPGNSVAELPDLWEEQETGRSKEAGLVKIIDRLLPFMLNIRSEGRSWKEHGIHKDQVLSVHQFIEKESPEIYNWIVNKVDYAVGQGWLKA